MTAATDMATLRVVLGDQLSHALSALEGADRSRDVVLMIEAADETEYVPHHKHKIVLVLSAMRHFARALERDGFRVDYVRLDDPANTGSFTSEVLRAVARTGATKIVATEPGEWRVLQAMQDWERAAGVPVEIRSDARFVMTRENFAAWARGRNGLRMEFFYRAIRRETGLLMDRDEPEGGRWNFDADNRRALPRMAETAPTLRFPPDAVTAEVAALVARRFPGNMGRVDTFGWAVTRADALRALDDFIARRLDRFGDYQDAMRRDDPFTVHSALSPYLNLGLLEPREVCARAEAAWRAGQAPLNAVEGFIRQILGWREFVRGVYWLKMPAYAALNALGADRPLHSFYWSGETGMACMRAAVGDTIAHGYSHHIQRLMVTGTFAMLAGVRPKEVCDWYLAVYVDAYEWVELPNTLGMSLFADGGIVGSKPYAASGAYIDRMSDFCAGCRYDVKKKSGPDACPFNRLYWPFLIRNEARLKGNPRLAMPYRQVARMDEREKRDRLKEADAALAGIDAM